MMLFCVLLALFHGSALACPPYEVRVQVMDELAQKHPQAAVLYLRRSQANLSLNRPQAALQDLAQARRLDPTLSQIAFQEGQAFVQLGQAAQAEQAFAKFLDKPPTDLTQLPQMQRLLATGPVDLNGFIRQSRQQVGELVWRYQDGELTEMLCDETASAEAARAQRAQALKALGRMDEAAQELQRLAQEHPGPDYELERARLLRSQGQHREALRALNRAIAAGGSLAVLEDEALDCELALKEPSDALLRAERLLREHPAENRPERLERQAYCLLAIGRSREAQRAYAAARLALEARPLRARQSPAGKALAKRIQLALQ